MIPVGGYYTFGPGEALDFAKSFKKICKIISMHYEISPETKEQFFELARGEFDVE